MRVWLSRDPKTIAIADYLATDRAFIGWLCDPVQRTCHESAYEHVTRDVTVRVTVASLLQVWGVVNEEGKAVGDDIIVRHATLETIDEIAGVPSLGEAMASVEWVIEEHYGESGFSLRFPKFLLHNIPVHQRQTSKHAERQRRYRQKLLSANGGVTSQEASPVRHRDVTPPSLVTHTEQNRTEQNKEEKNPPTPQGGERASRRAAKNAPPPEDFLRFWAAYPRKVAKIAAIAAWRRLAPDSDTITAILATLAKQVASEEWHRDGGRYIPHPATWLNGRRWDEEVTPASTTTPRPSAAPSYAETLRERIEKAKEGFSWRNGSANGSSDTPLFSESRTPPE